MTFNQGLGLRKHDIVRVRKTGEIGHVDTVNIVSRRLLQVAVLSEAGIKLVDCKALDLLNTKYSSNSSKPSICPICAKRSLSYDFNRANTENFETDEAHWTCSSCGAQGIELYSQTLIGCDFAGHSIINLHKDGTAAQTAS